MEKVENRSRTARVQNDSIGASTITPLLSGDRGAIPWDTIECEQSEAAAKVPRKPCFSLAAAPQQS
ncbi:hypothetical protein I6F35_34815 [Bradyrhizobium sp. BRP22]|uniref:hypothetical protein n=1 Tax=Bradyrhizobium sp. BRP22 TaxID=2793821 RepID=UPI001CD771F4|nr:hypothetical protein [Bradyrhizobium sp. BRP22]MCA1458292.1 hypothetical protein [Bradyrhizobium sp. BRP22]